MKNKQDFVLPELDDIQNMISFINDDIVSDYVKSLGIKYVENNGSFIISGGIYTNTMFSDDKGWKAHAIIGCDKNVYASCLKTNYYDMAVIPQIKYSIIKDRCIIKESKSNYLLVDYGEYPLKEVNDNLKKELYNEYKNGKLKTTNKSYIYGYTNNISYPEYTYNGRKFIRMKYKENPYTWIEVLPITWFVDLSKDIAISTKALFSNVQIKDVYKHLNKTFKEDIIPSNNMLLKNNIVKELPKNNDNNNQKMDKIISDLNSMEIKEVDTKSLDSLVNYGDELSLNTEYINNEYKKLIVNNLLETSLSNVENIVSEIRNIKPVSKRSIIERLSIKKGKIQKEQKEINIEILTKLNQSINKGINDLNRELIGYNRIKKYYELYVERLKKYIELTKQTIEKETELVNSLDEKSSERLNHLTNIEILKNKLNNFELSLVSKTNELVQLHESIINHYIAISSLKTARENLVPLIANEIVIKIGNNTEKNSLLLSECVIGLFNSLLTKNVDGTYENLERLKQSNLSEETINEISNNLILYLNGNELLDQNNTLKMIK